MSEKVPEGMQYKQTNQHGEREMKRKFALKSTSTFHHPAFVEHLPMTMGAIRFVPVHQATQFDTVEQAMDVLWLLGERCQAEPLTIVGIEEIPGETKRELVPLEGTVNFDELTGFVIRVPLPDGDGYLGGTHEDVQARTIGPNTIVTATLVDACTALRRQRTYGGLYIEGVRETTTPPMLRIISLEDALEAYEVPGEG